MSKTVANQNIHGSNFWQWVGAFTVLSSSVFSFSLYSFNVSSDDEQSTSNDKQLLLARIGELESELATIKGKKSPTDLPQRAGEFAYQEPARNLDEATRQKIGKLRMELRNWASLAEVASELGNIGPLAQDAIPDLLSELARTPNTNDQRAIVEALGKMGSESARQATPALEVQFRSNMDDRVRFEAARALARLGSTQALSAAMKDKTQQLPAAVGLSVTRPVPPDVLPVLIDTIDGPYSSFRIEALRSVGGMGDDAERAVPCLIRALRDDGDDDVQRFAAIAIGELGLTAKAAIPDLIRLVQYGEARSQTRTSEAARALGQMGPAAREAVPELEALLQLRDLSPDTFRVVKSVLRRIESDPLETAGNRR